MATQPVCAKCGGTGWIIVERANVSGAEACDCRSAGRAERIEDRAQIPPLYSRASFESFKVAGPYEQELKSVVTKVRQFIDEFPNGPFPGLLLIGESGCGKTHLAVAALRRIIQKGHEAIFCDYQTLLDRIRTGYDSASGASDKQAYRMALDTDVLLLDDLGAHRVTDWVQDTVTSIITHRCNNRKPLIATTNLPESAMQTSGGMTDYRRTLQDHIGARAHSRLFEMCRVIRVNAGDYRKRKDLGF
jgi:DNA replication protein DnaC